MNPNKRVTIYHRIFPLQGDSKVQPLIEQEQQFCAVFDPGADHFSIDDYVVAGTLFEEYGRSPLPSKHNIRPYIINRKGIVSFPESLLGDCRAEKMQEEGYRVGGFFFDESVSGLVIAGLRDLGYQVEKRYEEKRGVL